jgi:hypothetical protein
MVLCYVVKAQEFRYFIWFKGCDGSQFGAQELPDMTADKLTARKILLIGKNKE